MSFAHDARHLELLERAVSIALSPLDFADATDWGDALTAALCALAETKAGSILLPKAPARWRAVRCNSSADDLEAAWGLHEEATERWHETKAGDLVFWARDDLDNGSARCLAGSSGTIGIRIRTPSGAVGAVCVHRDRALGDVPDNLLAALRALAPAFRAGVAAWVSFNACRSNVTSMLDSVADPALLFDAAGELVHANPAVARLTRSVDASRLRGEAQHIAWALGATMRRRSQPSDAQGDRSVRIGSVVYRLRGSVVGEQLVGPGLGVLVTITTAAAEPLSDDALHADYGLTTREIEVARLLAEGLSNREIASRLGVRFFTARNHVERTLGKLGVSSRHRVGPLLRNEALAASELGRASAA